jgi:class 3 adenylate cyclase
VGSFFDQVRELAPCVRSPAGFVGDLVDPAERHGHHVGRPIGANVGAVSDDYLGKGVHEAARVGAAAMAGEILVTAPVIAAISDHRQVCNDREILLKGLALPLAVASVEWK